LRKSAQKYNKTASKAVFCELCCCEWVYVQKWLQIYTHKYNMPQIDKLAWIELKDKSILLTKSYGKDVFYIPGGKREAGESDDQALIREIREELSVSIDQSTLRFVGVFEAQAHGHPAGVTVKMTCYTGQYAGELTANSEIEALRWFHYAEKDQVADVDKIIFDYLHQQNLLD
jgi:8-oxo-dGTP diphosphatase